jgi:hypothetical protein
MIKNSRLSRKNLAVAPGESAPITKAPLAYAQTVEIARFDQSILWKNLENDTLNLED